MKYVMIAALILWLIVAAVGVNAYWLTHKTSNTRDIAVLIEDWHWQDSIKYKEGDIVKYHGVTYERTFVASGHVIKPPGDNPFWEVKE